LLLTSLRVRPTSQPLLMPLRVSATPQPLLQPLRVRQAPHLRSSTEFLGGPLLCSVGLLIFLQFPVAGHHGLYASVGLHVFGAGRVARLNSVPAGDDLLVARLNSVPAGDDPLVTRQNSVPAGDDLLVAHLNSVLVSGCWVGVWWGLPITEANNKFEMANCGCRCGESPGRRDNMSMPPGPYQ
ncbi:hypothetical protein AMECASPLE_026099, partial [Ameca splendens]